MAEKFCPYCILDTSGNHAWNCPNNPYQMTKCECEKEPDDTTHIINLGTKIHVLEAELTALRKENKILKNRIERLKKSKCPKCGYVFGIAKLSEHP